VSAPPRILPYGRQSIEADDIAAVVAALQGDYLTTGPLVPRFERALADAVGAQEAVAVSNCTAALHLCARALDLIEGTISVVPAITFLATANAVRLTGGDVVFADVDPATGLMTPETLHDAIRSAPKAPRAVFPVHLAGPSCDMAAIADLAARVDMAVVEDAAHAIGTTTRQSAPVGAGRHAAMTCFSFHPVKTMTTVEGGAITLNDPGLAARLRRDRSHGMIREQTEFLRPELGASADGLPNPWYYEMQEPGLNYRLTDVQCALGLTQLSKLDRFKRARAQAKAHYDTLLAPLAPLVAIPKTPVDQDPAWHLYPVQIDFDECGLSRAEVMRRLRGDGVMTQVHYVPLHWQPYYRARHGARNLPGAERYYARTLSLPLFPGIGEDGVQQVAGALRRALRG
jgi:UDP-4-amino-4,6-dideoxy-N-acetyl-beta-L-altrosamine transaminase